MRLKNYNMKYCLLFSLQLAVSFDVLAQADTMVVADSIVVTSSTAAADSTVLTDSVMVAIAPDLMPDSMPDSETFMPFFAGCLNYSSADEDKRDCSNITCQKFIAANLKYPAAAMEGDIEGTVFIVFQVGRDGRVINPKVMRDIGGGCGEEALRVVKDMPAWEFVSTPPADMMPIEMSLPVRFVLNSTETGYASGFTISWGDIRGGVVSKEQLKKAVETPVIVRDEMGNEMEVNELSFAFERDNVFEEAQSNGEMNASMRKLIRQLKKDDTFVVTATVQKGGKFLFVERSFRVEK